MTWSWLLAALHLLGLGIGLGAIWARAQALSGPLDRAGLNRVLVADSWWGVSAIVWIVTGLLRAFAGFEKGTQYYLHNHFFLLKMALLLGVLALELAPMIALVRARIAIGRGLEPDVAMAPRYARSSYLQAGLIVAMVLCATAMARGIGQVG